jgi:helix-turn-helix protein
MTYVLAAVEQAMTRQEAILRALSGRQPWLQVAEVLGMTARTVRRLRWRYEHYGYDGLFDRRRRRPSPRCAPVEEVQRVLRLYREHYVGFNARHFYDIARRQHELTLRAGAIVAAVSRAPASVSSCILTAAAIIGWPSSPTSGSPSSSSWTTPPSACSMPSSPRAARVARP